MLRLILFLAGVLLAALSLGWLADRPGSIVVDWQGYQVETTLFRSVVILALVAATFALIWSVLRQVWAGPASISSFFSRRRQQRGLDAISSGMIAIGAGDGANAARYALMARKTLPNEPLTHLLRAQAAHLSGDKATTRRIYEAMLSSPDTEQLGLRGLFVEALREGETEAAQQFAERALTANPKLAWAARALFDIHCKGSDWPRALDMLAAEKRNHAVPKVTYDRQRAVLLTAQAQKLEDPEPERALTLALEAHGLAPSLIPAAAIAGRVLASRGQTAKAAKAIEKTWAKSPHPELATAYAFARIGDSPRDRVDRIKRLAGFAPGHIESAIAVATTAIDAKYFDEARAALAPYLDDGLTRRVAMLMARIEGEENGNKGRVREWIARSVAAGADPAWTADGVVADAWAPVSPTSGALDAFEWRVPDSERENGKSRVTEALQDWVAIGGVLDDPAIDVITSPRPLTGTMTEPARTRTNGRHQSGSKTGLGTSKVPSSHGALSDDADPQTMHPDDPGIESDETDTASAKNGT